jgi:hypothetical protein
MDNMATGWDRPQEDEFALALLGSPSTYSDCAFPNHPPMNANALDLSQMSRWEQHRWRRTLKKFLQTVQFRDPRPLILKSPPHTARIRTLLTMFPQARFVHIVRDPYVVYPSTLNLWTTMNGKHGFQRPRSPHLVREKVFREFRTLYERYLEDRSLIPVGQLAEVRYEDLVRDIPGTVEQIYDTLQLGDWPNARPRLEQYVQENQGYERNRWALTEAERTEVRAQWGDIIDALGYGDSPPRSPR